MDGWNTSYTRGEVWPVSGRVTHDSDSEDNILSKHLFSVPQPTLGVFFPSHPWTAVALSGYRMDPPWKFTHNSGVTSWNLKGFKAWISRKCPGEFLCMYDPMPNNTTYFFRDIPQKLDTMVWICLISPKKWVPWLMTHDPWMPSISLEPGFHYVNHHCAKGQSFHRPWSHPLSTRKKRTVKHIPSRHKRGVWMGEM